VVPYTCCTDVEMRLQEFNNLALEITVDVIFAVNSLVIFITAVKGDFDYQRRFTKIAYKYVTSMMFLVDLLSTLPMMITWYDQPNLYYFKLLRLFYL
jgi:hypothetical protein